MGAKRTGPFHSVRVLGGALRPIGLERPDGRKHGDPGGAVVGCASGPTRFVRLRLDADVSCGSLLPLIPSGRWPDGAERAYADPRAIGNFPRRRALRTFFREEAEACLDNRIHRGTGSSLLGLSCHDESELNPNKLSDHPNGRPGTKRKPILWPRSLCANFEPR